MVQKQFLVPDNIIQAFLTGSQGLTTIIKMNKIIGFTVSKSPINHEDIDIFGVGLNAVKCMHGGLHLYLWGIGKLEHCKIEESFTLSFPPTRDLLDRNILIHFNNDAIVVENDWLGSIPVFYNPSELIVSTLPLKTLQDKTIHPEGLQNYFEFGYSILEQTAFADVKFLRYFSKLLITQDRIEISYKDDPLLHPSTLQSTVDEEEVLTKIEDYIKGVESLTSGEIILPTSGGYDSRLLNLAISDKSRIHAFTYGISKDQSQSFEVVYAKKISETLRTKWKQIELGNFYRYIPEWFKLYGFATHLHGMYHIEFYKKILDSHPFSNHATFLSGIFGDVWAGNVQYQKIDTSSDLIHLGYTHGLKLDSKFSLVQSNAISKKTFINENRDALKLNHLKPAFSIRFKLILISYLTQLPEYFGIPVWTPFLNFHNVIGMLTIPVSRRKNRVWQKEYFARQGLDLESKKITIDLSNTLDYEASKIAVFEPIDPALMGKYVQKNHIDRINATLTKYEIWDDIKNRLLATPGIRALCRMFSIQNNLLNCLYAYFVIKAIEMSLKYDR